jgi:hypothetical protein
MIGGYGQTTSDPMRAAEPATILHSEVERPAEQFD